MKNANWSTAITQIVLIMVIFLIGAGIALTETIPVPTALLVVVPVVPMLFKKRTSQFFFRSLLSAPGLILFLVSIYAIGLNSQSRFAYILNSLALLIVLAVFVNNEERLEKLTVVVMLFLVASSVVFILRVNDVALGNEIHAFLYGSNLEKSSPQPGGLTLGLHQFGYHGAAGFPLLTALILYSPSRRYIGIYALLLTLVSWALLSSGQRGAVISAFVGFLLVGMIRPNRIFSLRTVSVVLLAFLILNTVPIPLLESKIQEKYEVDFRMELQKRALTTIVQQPFGLMFSNKSWDDYAAGLFEDRAAVTAHNSYLVFVLELGWVFGVYLFFTLLISFKTFRKDIATKNPRVSPYRIGLMGSFLALSTNALFHNSSIVTLEGVTWISFAVLWMWHYVDISHSEVPQSARNPTTGRSTIIKPIKYTQ